MTLALTHSIIYLYNWLFLPYFENEMESLNMASYFLFYAS